MKKHIYENFERHFPFVARNAKRIKESSYDELIVEMNDGEMILYDDIDKTFRRLPSNSADMTEIECRREFGIRLRRMMFRKNISQSELSELTGISSPILSGYMNGRHSPSFYNVDRIAKALGCSIDDLRYI